MIGCDVKIVLLGGAYIGKTSMVKRFVENEFNNNAAYQNTFGGAFTTKRIKLKSGVCLVLGIWDTAGEERFDSISYSFYRNSNAAIICYDITYLKSWNQAKKWVAKLKRTEKDCLFYLCAMKMDLLREGVYNTRVIPQERVNVYASEHQMKYFETSSKTGLNIEELFTTIAEDYYNQNPDVVPCMSTIDIRRTNSLQAISRNKACCLSL